MWDAKALVTAAPVAKKIPSSKSFFNPNALHASDADVPQTTATSLPSKLPRQTAKTPSTTLSPSASSFASGRSPVSPATFNPPTSQTKHSTDSQPLVELPPGLPNKQAVNQPAKTPVQVKQPMKRPISPSQQPPVKQPLSPVQHHQPKQQTATPAQQQPPVQHQPTQQPGQPLQHPQQPKGKGVQPLKFGSKGRKFFQRPKSPLTKLTKVSSDPGLKPSPVVAIPQQPPLAHSADSLATPAATSPPQFGTPEWSAVINYINELEEEEMLELSGTSI